MKPFLCLSLLIANSLFAQQHIAQFVIWKPKPGQEAAFTEGYKKHLDWHKANGDTWSWYAWFFVTGPRFGQFIDATIDHPWSDFDHSVKPTEDGPDADLHVGPYGDVQNIQKMTNITSLSTADVATWQSKYLRWITMDIQHPYGDVAIKLLGRWEKAHPAQNICVLRSIDGDSVGRLHLLLFYPDMASYGAGEDILQQLQMAQGMSGWVFRSISSETLVYQPGMSWVH